LTGFRASALLSVCLWALTISSGGAREPQEPVRVELSDEAMGTTFTVTAAGANRDVLTRAARAALDEAARLDRLLSNYQADSEWSRVNREAAHGPVVVSRELFDIFAACLDYSRSSHGAFDVSVGPLMRTWGFFKGEGALPTADAVRRALDDVGVEQIRLDRAASTVRFLRPGVELDPGGIGKGYAIDRMAAVLRGRGVRTAFLSAGGSSIYGLGVPAEDARGWNAKIRDPWNADRVVAEVFLRDASLSTSGGYEKFFRAGGRVYSHIMDPRTGFPAVGTALVSVVAPRAIDSEAWTKAFFVNGPAWTAANRPKGMRVFFCEEERPCAWIE
jgi:thiamine biosynthesis lipoprotein